ncbi:MAG: beta-phosphoglucomutase [Thermosynechococcaceae cyanobacterium MS004]|nr:beta-phosphoglucomutase [Thermosynechococcaceae cyanobacterium MS004]
MQGLSEVQNLTYTDWVVLETQFSPELLHTRETVFTLGNGYLGTRGSFEEGYPQAVPATLIHGVFDAVPIVYTELANCPNWLPLTLSINGESFRLDQGTLLRYERSLDLRQGLLSRKVRWQSPHGRTVDLKFERWASMADPHVLAIRCEIVPLDFEGFVEVQASLNGYPENQGFNHWELLQQGKEDRSIWLSSRTRSSHIRLGMTAQMNLVGADTPLQSTNVPGYPTLSTTFLVQAGEHYAVEKLITIYTSRETTDPLEAAIARQAGLPSYQTLKAEHIAAWAEIWDKCDIDIEGDTRAQLALRYNLFQLLICGSRTDDRVSIPAKTLSGFGYRGHVFWDTEIFILPFFTFTQPDTAKRLLNYRYHTLEGARRKALNYGYKGAMYAWESADTGDEVTPRWSLPNQPYAEDVRIWCRDQEIHISADIAFAIWQYWQATQDDPWLRDYGAEIILDTAIFWSSRVDLNIKSERYEIREVIGADEYHEHVSNNAFTNRMAQWHLEQALFVCDWLQASYPETFAVLHAKLNLSDDRRSRWRDIVQNIWIPYDPKTGLIEEFEGFFKLKDLDLATYEPRQQSMQALLGIEGANQHQVLKQPDVLMLMYLMRFSQGFPYREDWLQVNWDYYAPRTDITYGSSLGPAIHSILAADLKKTAEAYERFMQAALVDLEDVRDNAADGIHGASAGGLWQAAIFGFGGIQLTPEGLIANPHLPPGWTRLRFRLHWRGKWYDFDLKPPISDRQKYPDIQGVIFDLDGVLTDTAEYHYHSWQKLADEEGLFFNRQANEALRGVSRRDSLLRILGNRQVPEEKFLEMMDRKNHYYVSFIQDISPKDLLPGALTLLQDLRQRKIRIALGSASKNAKPVIERLGIADFIDFVADGHSVEHSKPAPDLFLFAAHHLGLEPQHCLVIEDAASGVEAALAAKMWAVGLGPQERVGKAHVVLPNLAGLTWSDLLIKLSETEKHASFAIH